MNIYSIKAYHHLYKIVKRGFYTLKGVALERVVADQVLYEHIHIQEYLCPEQLILWLEMRRAMPANRAEASPAASGGPLASRLNGDLANDAAG
jgi:hypothetical protein